MSAQQRRQERELEERRKQGLAMPERDETGQLINPHIPAYLSKTPWYVSDSTQPTLKHQRKQPSVNDLEGGINSKRIEVITNEIKPQSYRAGACTNCGALGHNKANCLMKPKLNSAKVTNQTYAKEDYIVKDHKLSYEAKRDRFSTFTTDNWLQLQKEQDEKNAQDLAKFKQIQGEKLIQEQLRLKNEKIKLAIQYQNDINLRHELLLSQKNEQQQQQQRHQQQQQTTCLNQNITNTITTNTNMNDNDNQPTNTTTTTTDSTTTNTNNTTTTPTTPPTIKKYIFIDPDNYDTDDELDDIYQTTNLLLNDLSIEEQLNQQKVLSIEDRIQLDPKFAATIKRQYHQPSTTTTTSSTKDKNNNIDITKQALDLFKRGHSTLGAHGIVTSSQPTTDVPKYLINIDDDNAYYDPKTHSMRENPFDINDPRYNEYEIKYRQHLYAKDYIKELELFALEFNELTGKEVNPTLNPTLVQQLKNEYDELKLQQQLNKEELLNTLYGNIFHNENNTLPTSDNNNNNHNDENVTSTHINKKQRNLTNQIMNSEYEIDPNNITDLNNIDDDTHNNNNNTNNNNNGDINNDHNNNDDNQLVILSKKKKNIYPTTTNTTTIIGNDNDTIIAGQSTISQHNNMKSKLSHYDEDVLEGNHITIWGSYYDIKDKKWGYKCCQSTTRFSYCIPIQSNTTTTTTNDNNNELNEINNNAIKRKNPSTNDE